MSAAQVRPMSSSPAASSIRASASLAAHLGTLQHTIPLHSRYDNFIGGRWVATDFTVAVAEFRESICAYLARARCVRVP
jgi:hypothetical protein